MFTRTTRLNLVGTPRNANITVADIIAVRWPETQSGRGQ
jgi:hypothetical protein